MAFNTPTMNERMAKLGKQLKNIEATIGVVTEFFDRNLEVCFPNQDESDETRKKRKTEMNDSNMATIGTRTNLDQQMQEAWQEYVESGVIAGQSLYVCRPCGKVRRRRLDMKRHVNKKHLGIKFTICAHCGKVAAGENQVSSHGQAESPTCARQHDDAESSDDEIPTEATKKFPGDDAAPQRKKVANNENNGAGLHEAGGEDEWRKYIRSMDIAGQKRYECTVCHKTSDRTSRMKDHINGHHLGVVFTCVHCGHTTRSMKGLVEHTKRHHPEVKLTCPQCQYTTVIASCLSHHMANTHHHVAGSGRRHSSQNEIVDENEPREKQKTWREFIQIGFEDGRWKYKCIKCGTTTVSSTYIKEHINGQHIGVTYACPHCDYTPNHKKHLNQHIREVHYKVRHQCPHCDYSSSRLSGLRNHMVQVHHITNPEQKAMN